MIRSAAYVLSSLRAGEHCNAVRYVHCPTCAQAIAAERWELHHLLCKPKGEPEFVAGRR